MMYQRFFLFAIAMLSVLVKDACADQGLQASGRKLHGVAKVTLLSQEGDSYEVPRSIALMSELVKSMIENDDSDDNDEEDEVFPFPNVTFPNVTGRN
jgi:hypothetical protein